MGRIGNGIFLAAAAITASVGAELPPLAKGLILALGAASAVSLTVPRGPRSPAGRGGQRIARLEPTGPRSHRYGSYLAGLPTAFPVLA
jgi:hypothetical protein